MRMAPRRRSCCACSRFEIACAARRAHAVLAAHLRRSRAVGQLQTQRLGGADGHRAKVEDGALQGTGARHVSGRRRQLRACSGGRRAQQPRLCATRYWSAPTPISHALAHLCKLLHPQTRGHGVRDARAGCRARSALGRRELHRPAAVGLVQVLLLEAHIRRHCTAGAATSRRLKKRARPLDRAAGAAWRHERDKYEILNWQQVIWGCHLAGLAVVGGARMV